MIFREQFINIPFRYLINGTSWIDCSDSKQKAYEPPKSHKLI